MLRLLDVLTPEEDQWPQAAGIPCARKMGSRSRGGNYDVVTDTRRRLRMANYKRKKCRYQGARNFESQAYNRKRAKLKPYRLPKLMDRDPGIDYWPGWYRGLMSNNPRWWDILFHNRPRRRAESRCLNALKWQDPDNLAWPPFKETN